MGAVQRCIFVILWHYCFAQNIENEDCWTQGACLQSVMINAKQAEDPLSCENFCKHLLPECNWFTWYGDKGICTALTECVKLTGEVDNSISGQSQCNGKPECNVEGRCSGVLIDVSKSQTPENCQEICQSLENCGWFTYDSANSGCFSLEDCASISECSTCTSGQSTCPTKGPSVILVAGGRPFRNLEMDASRYAEIFSTLEQNISIEVPPLLTSLVGAVSTMAFGKSDYKVPLICGGLQNDHITNECFGLYNDVVNTTLGFEGYDWVQDTLMSEARVHAASVDVLESGMTNEANWWISGGIGELGEPLKTSEIRWSNGTWGQGPLLPEAVYGHCVVQIQRQKSLVLGGHPTHSNYIFDWITKEWSVFPSLQNNRYYHSCGLIRNNVLGAKYPNNVVVVGGISAFDENKVLASTEVFYSDLNAWQPGPNFPRSVYGGAIVQASSDEVIVLGGGTNFGGEVVSEVYSLSKSNFGAWTYLGSLALPRFAHIAVKIPVDEFVGLKEDELIESIDLQ